MFFAGYFRSIYFTDTSLSTFDRGPIQLTVRGELLSVVQS
tara:strand:+ start:297 stop:416 length:120 start_codon:yes stop_codon:yes gene_type:complete